MRKAESAGIRDLESCLLVRLAMKASWLSLPSCIAAQGLLTLEYFSSSLHRTSASALPVLPHSVGCLHYRGPLCECQADKAGLTCHGESMSLGNHRTAGISALI